MQFIACEVYLHSTYFWDVIPVLFSLEKQNMLQTGSVWHVDKVLWGDRWGNIFNIVNEPF